MPQGKFHTYENDIRVPFLIRGPGILPGAVRDDILGTHVDIMPTLLGLVAADRGGNFAVPSTMDGENLAWELLFGEDYGKGRRRRSAILVEYIGLGDVVRYGHLEDCYNNTFRALRVIDETHPEKARRNLKYVEFTDCRNDWNFTNEPTEVELFDISADPFELTNLVSSADDDLISQLREETRRLFTCSGHSCRDVWKEVNYAAEEVL